MEGEIGGFGRGKWLRWEGGNGLGGKEEIGGWEGSKGWGWEGGNVSGGHNTNGRDRM